MQFQKVIKNQTNMTKMERFFFLFRKISIKTQKFKYFTDMGDDTNFGQIKPERRLLDYIRCELIGCRVTSV